MQWICVNQSGKQQQQQKGYKIPSQYCKRIIHPVFVQNIWKAEENEDEK